MSDDEAARKRRADEIRQQIARLRQGLKPDNPGSLRDAIEDAAEKARKPRLNPPAKKGEGPKGDR